MSPAPFASLSVPPAGGRLLFWPGPTQPEGNTGTPSAGCEGAAPGVQGAMRLSEIPARPNHLVSDGGTRVGVNYDEKIKGGIELGVWYRAPARICGAGLQPATGGTPGQGGCRAAREPPSPSPAASGPPATEATREMRGWSLGKAPEMNISVV